MTTTDESPLRGRLAVITGGGRGIGAAIADRLHALGADLLLLGRTESSLREKCGQLARAEYATVDVTDEAAVERFFLELDEMPDILVNNAGAAQAVPFERLDPEDWRATLAVNLDGVFYCCRAVAGSMKARGSGRIVNVASTAALRGYRYVAAYCAAKHGVLGLTRALALELAGHGVTVNAVCPGFTETDLLVESIETIRKSTGRSEEEARRSLMATNPQGRFVQPSEVADAVAWLVGDGAAAITGQAISVSGGEVM